MVARVSGKNRVVAKWDDMKGFKLDELKSKRELKQRLELFAKNIRLNLYEIVAGIEYGIEQGLLTTDEASRYIRVWDTRLVLFDLHSSTTQRRGNW